MFSVFLQVEPAITAGKSLAGCRTHRLLTRTSVQYWIIVCMICSVGGSWVNVASQATLQPWRDRTGLFQRKTPDQRTLPQVKCFCSNEAQFVLKPTGSEPRDTLRTLNADVISLFPSIIPVLSIWARVLCSEEAVQQASGVCRSTSHSDVVSHDFPSGAASKRFCSLVLCSQDFLNGYPGRLAANQSEPRMQPAGVAGTGLTPEPLYFEVRGGGACFILHQIHSLESKQRGSVCFLRMKTSFQIWATEGRSRSAPDQNLLLLRPTRSPNCPKIW